MSKVKSPDIKRADLAWRRLTSKEVADCRVFRVRQDTSASPQNGLQHDFFIIEAPDWVNIVPITPDGRVVLIEQYRHGTNEIALEIPGGMVDRDESPFEAAKRELLEETGFGSDYIELTTQTRPNPAIQNNWLHTFVARDCVFEQEPKFDGSEQIAVRLVPVDDIPDLIRKGTINHALVVVAFYSLFMRMSST
jgi:8-oxo-dGTP pyrophosphatase MutT (NUDIX family)